MGYDYYITTDLVIYKGDDVFAIVNIAYEGSYNFVAKTYNPPETVFKDCEWQSLNESDINTFKYFLKKELENEYRNSIIDQIVEGEYIPYNDLGEKISTKPICSLENIISKDAKSKVEKSFNELLNDPNTVIKKKIYYILRE